MSANLIKEDPAPIKIKTVQAIYAHLESVYTELKTFGNQCEIVGGHDSLFNFRDWLRMFRYMPRLRKDLLLGFLWNTVTRRLPSKGFCVKYTPGKKYNFFHRSFCDLMIWEAILRSAKHFGEAVSEGLRACLESNLALIEHNGREMIVGGEKITLFSYYPGCDHLIDPKHPAYAYFNSWDAHVPDNDSTCIILSALLSIQEQCPWTESYFPHTNKDQKHHLQILKDHIFRKGQLGQGSLSYENGVSDDDSGILTWVGDAHNELDPTSNINILNYLLHLWIENPGETRVSYLMESILKFLLNHIRQNTFLNPRFQQYYPLGAIYYFWYRLCKTYAKYGDWPVSISNSIEGIQIYLEREATQIFVNGLKPYNENDWVSAAPWMIYRGILPMKQKEKLLNPEYVFQNFNSDRYEIFHLLYPSKIICVADKMPFACYLDALVELDLSTSRS
jgi:hypothetical protein